MLWPGARQGLCVYGNNVDPCKGLTDGARSCCTRAAPGWSMQGPAKRVPAPPIPLFGKDPTLGRFLGTPRGFTEAAAALNPFPKPTGVEAGQSAQPQPWLCESKLQGHPVRCGEPGLRASTRWSRAGGRMGENHSNYSKTQAPHHHALLSPESAATSSGDVLHRRGLPGQLRVRPLPMETKQTRSPRSKTSSPSSPRSDKQWWVLSHLLAVMR